jgi:hypothetical protein
VSNPRRIIAATGSDGKSCVISNEAIPPADSQPMAATNVWNGAAGRVSNSAPFGGGFTPFGMHQLTDSIYSLTIAEFAPGLGKDDPGMHFTETADHFYVIAGEVKRAGDLGVCRGAMHGWRNDSGAIARMLTFMLPAEPLER